MTKPKLLIDETIQRIEYILRSIGINVKIGEKTQRDKYICWFIYIVNFIWLNTDLAGAMMWFFTGIAEHKKFTELTYIAPCITFSNLANLKTYCMVMNVDKIESFITVLRNLEIEQKDRVGDSETENIIKSDHNFLNRVIKVLSIFYGCLLACFAVNPLLLVLLKYLETNEVELFLPFLIIYPFDPFDMRYYPWIYLRQIWSEFVVVLGICGPDFLFYIFCTYLRMQFRLLQCYMKNVIPPESKNGTVHNKEEIRLKLVAIIKWHQQIISSVDLLETLYTRSTLFNFVASSVLICLTGFNVVAIDDIAFVMSFLCFLLTSLLQIFFLCFFGDLLMESSIAIGDAIYHSRWYMTDTSLAKSLLFIQTRTQIPCKLTACNYADVNLKAFMKICSSAWSYFALLQTLYSGPAE